MTITNAEETAELIFAEQRAEGGLGPHAPWESVRGTDLNYYIFTK